MLSARLCVSRGFCLFTWVCFSAVSNVRAQEYIHLACRSDLEAHLACRSDLEAHLACRSDHSPKARWILSRNTVGISAGSAFDWASRKTSSTHLMSEAIKRLPIDEGGNQTPSDASRKTSSTHRHPYERNCSDAIRRNQTQSDAIRRNQTYRHPSDERNCSAAYASVAESPAACCSHPATASSSGPAWAGAGGAESRVRPKARCAGPLCTAFGGKVKHEI